MEGIDRLNLILTDIANIVREQNKTTDLIAPKDLPSAIRNSINVYEIASISEIDALFEIENNNNNSSSAS
jgi:hypothetical protein